jgi:predicted nucleic acid-binding protein
MIIDTNAVSALANGELSVREKVMNVPGPFLPVIVIGEYRFGLPSSRERQKRLEWLKELNLEWLVPCVI